MEFIKCNEIETIKPNMCGYITQNGDFYPSIGFDATHGVDGNYLWMKEDLIFANKFALSKLEKLKMPFKIEEYQRLKDSIGETDFGDKIARYIVNELATIKFARLHEQRYGNAKDKTIYPYNEGLITTEALITLSWLYGINYNPNSDFKDVQTEPVKRLLKKTGTLYNLDN